MNLNQLEEFHLDVYHVQTSVHGGGAAPHLDKFSMSLSAYARLIFLLCLFSYFSKAQNVTRKNNSIYAEFLGNGGSFISINYEHVFKAGKKNLIQFSSRIGFSFSSSKYDKATMYNIPLEFSTLIGKKRHLLELGVGGLLF